jgi:hypothetical protein
LGSVLHGSARTTPRIRAELQASQESSRALAVSYGLDVKTVRKWRGRTTTADAPMGPKRLPDCADPPQFRRWPALSLEPSTPRPASTQQPWANLAAVEVWL